jgi:addiction module RelE/StbE family toxin
MTSFIDVKWDNEAKADLKLIFDYIKLDSLQNAKKVVNTIVMHCKSIRFGEQYQLDEFLGEPYRRMIVGHYKIAYKIHTATEIRILQIFDTRQNPSKLRKK